MRLNFLYFILLAPFLVMGQAISYHTLGGGITSCTSIPAVRTMYYDSIDGKLYAGGFLKWAEGKVAQGITVWDGSSWDTLAGGLTQYPHSTGGVNCQSEWVHKLIRFQNNIYVSGGFQWVNGKPQGGYAIYNGSTWVYPIIDAPNAMIQDFKVYNGNLYACGLFTKFNNTTCNYIARFDGVSWQPVGDFGLFCKGDTPAQINAIEFFNGELYIGGLFDDSTNVTRNIAKFNGTEWINVSMGIQQGGINAVWDLAVFKNELYIGGRFSASIDIPENCIIKWDGNNFKPVGQNLSTQSTVWAFKSTKKHLFVQGILLDENDPSLYNVFYVDSEAACSIVKMKDIAAQSQISCIESIGDSLIVGGDFDTIGTIQANSVAAIRGYEDNSHCKFVGLSENALLLNTKIYPNPFKNTIHIEISLSELHNSSVQIFNSFGQEIRIIPLSETSNVYDLSFLPIGIYFFKLQNSETQKVYKVIKN
jgi:hypothetical protein